jgi:hypothetical protein
LSGGGGRVHGACTYFISHPVTGTNGHESRRDETLTNQAQS